MSPRKILTKKFQLILVDEADYEAMSLHTWYVNKDGYAQTMLKRADGKSRPMMMHRLLMDASRGMEVDHRNRCKLDNQRHNLRIATHSQNQANRKKQRTSGNQYKGVRFDKHDCRWHASATKNGIKHVSRGFRTEIEAAHEYDRMALALHGEFARVNFQQPADTIVAA